MRGCIVYPPIAYPNMPPLAPFMLKGFVESASHHSVLAKDLNILFFNKLWSGEFFKQDHIGNNISLSKREQILIELVSKKGLEGFSKLRVPSTYQNKQLLASQYFILNCANKMLEVIHRQQGFDGKLLPDDFNLWSTMIINNDGLLISKFLHDEVDSGNYDDFDFIGLSVAYVEQLIPVLSFAANLKDRNKNKIIIIGGSVFTHILKDVVRDQSFWHHIDYGIPFEGEAPLLELLNVLEKNRNSDVMNLENVIIPKKCDIYYQRNIGSKPKISTAADFSDLVHKYPTPRPIYPMLTSKGCYWAKCSFCTHHEGYGHGYLKFNISDIHKGVENIISRGGRDIYFVDEAFSISSMLQIAEIINEANAKIQDKINWMAEARLEKAFLKEENIKIIADSGCRFIVNGIESGSSRVRDLMNKKIDMDSYRTFLQFCGKYQIKIGQMFFIGFPTETEQEAQETFDLIRDNQDLLDFATVGTFALERGSPIWYSPLQYGIDEIYNIDTPYRVIFDYRIAKTGEIRKRSEIKDRLEKLMGANLDLQRIFSSVIDRAFVIFNHELVNKKDALDGTSSSDCSLSWKSDIHLDTTIVIDIENGKINLIKNVAKVARESDGGEK